LRRKLLFRHIEDTLLENAAESADERLLEAAQLF
jgi:hypothetical protein